MDLHQGFTGGELRGKGPSYLRAGARHLQAIGHLLRGRLIQAARAEWQAAREAGERLSLDLRRRLGRG
jgi:hypothetical protein